MIDVRATIERLALAYRESGGDADAVLVCNSHVHREYLESAEGVLGYPVRVREWAPTPNVLLESVRDLRAQDKVYAEMDRAFGLLGGADDDAIEIRLRLPSWYCNVCKANVLDPENHQYHGTFPVPDEDAP